MARNDTEKNNQEISTTKERQRKSLSQIEQERIEKRRTVIEKALLADKVRYKSSCDSAKFQDFLQNKLTFWETKKDKTFHAKNMFEKTKAILTDFKP